MVKHFPERATVKRFPATDAFLHTLDFFPWRDSFESALRYPVEAALRRVNALAWIEGARFPTQSVDEVRLANGGKARW